MLGALVLGACASGWSGATQPQATPIPTPPPEYAGKTNPLADDAAAGQAGEQIFDANCTTCHGTDGKGDGPAAASLDPRPSNLADTKSRFSDAYLFWRVSEGGAMPPFDSLMPSWKGILTEDQIWQVISYLRTLG
jgi:mono/diheme cytochrome c family protein